MKTFPVATAHAVKLLRTMSHRRRGDTPYAVALRMITGLKSAVANSSSSPSARTFEIPLHAKLLAESGKYQAIVAAGFIVDGGIYRHEFVSTAVIDGLMRVQLDTRVPVFSVVLTPQRFHEHEEHRRFFVEHFLVKGREAASTLVRTLEGLAKLR